MPGKLPKCKKGDAVVTIGLESSAPNVRIVFEAKNDKSYTLKKALEELQQARENREADYGVFVFGCEAVPAGLEAIGRYGSDVVVIWDAEDTLTDVNLKAAFSISRCIAVEKSRVDTVKTGERVAVEEAVKSISRSIEMLNSIQTMATTVRNNGEKIAKQATKILEDVSTQLERIDQHVAGLG